MATLVLMPKVGISVESCLMTKWNKKKGDSVKKGETLFSYETDKAAVDEEASEDGTVLEIFHPEGDDVPVMEGVCVIGAPGEDISQYLNKAPAAAKPEAEENPAPAAGTQKPAPTAPAAAPGEKVKASPRARALAQRAGVNVAAAVPTGPEGRVIERDVRELIRTGAVIKNEAPVKAPVSPAPAAKAVEPAGAAYEEEKLPRIRQLIAKSMHDSLSEMAQLTLNASFDATELMGLRKSFKTKGEALGLQGVTVNDMLLFAVSRVLKNHRAVNANLVDGVMRYFSAVNLGVAVDTERGLMVPTIFDADQKSLAEISKETKLAIDGCRSGGISPDRLQGGTFTVTNLGSLGVESFTPVINPPQTAILGVCTITDRVRRGRDGGMELYPAMGLSLTFDHRAVDGAPAARFLQELKTSLESFSLLMAK